MRPDMRTVARRRPGRLTCHHGGLAEQAHVKLSGNINGRYVVTDRRPGGGLTLVLDTSR